MSTVQYGWEAFLPEITRIVDENTAAQDVKIHTVQAAIALCDMLGGLRYEHTFEVPRTLDWGEEFIVPLPCPVGCRARTVASVLIDGVPAKPLGNAASYHAQYELRGEDVYIRDAYRAGDAITAKLTVTSGVWIEAGNVPEEMPAVLYEKYYSMMFNLIAARVAGVHTQKGKTYNATASNLLRATRAHDAQQTGRTRMVGNTRSNW